MKLSIGMAHYDDYDGAYFTIQDIRKELVCAGKKDLLDQIEFVVVDNNPDSAHGEALKRLLERQVTHTNEVKLIHKKDAVGTSSSRDAVIKNATGDWVMVMDCHVLLCPTQYVIEQVFEFIENNADSPHLYSGPLITDNFQTVHTHFNLDWSCGMWGQWGVSFSCQCGGIFTAVRPNGCIIYRDIVTQKPITKCGTCGVVFPPIGEQTWKKALKRLGYTETGWSGAAFEIPAQGLGLFLTNREKWLGFNPHHRGFGGEEGYIHEKYRMNGRKAICLSWLKWLHRFNRPNNVPYPLSNDDKIRNYILEFSELGKDITPIIEHFQSIGCSMNIVPPTIDEVKQIYGVM